MRPSRFTEGQVIGILKEQEAGAAMAGVCRKHGISSTTFYKCKAKHGGMDVSGARRLKALINAIALVRPRCTRAAFNELNLRIIQPASTLRAAWRSLGDSNPCFRRERATS